MVNGVDERLTEGNLSKFAKAYHELINKDWLLTGKGDMERVDLRTLRPHIPVLVEAGFKGVPVPSVPEEECELMPLIPGMPNYDFTINVTGDSMEPEMHSGDLLVCAWLDDPVFKPNRYYVIDTADGAVVKRVSLEGHKLVCRSLNPIYPMYKVPTAIVQRVAEVKGIIRAFN